ncbi:MAG TPA: MBL fold metallo-hydrolase [Bryobacteraceae bacterium]|nr:MBL fold metallo-hydrolase [Bryobacteraceae bacterium]
MREIIPGVHLIVLPLPFELEAINVYLVAIEGGYLLIDCGMDTQRTEDILGQSLESIGASWTDIRKILLTHMHPDHVGLCGKVRTLSGAKVLMHWLEAEHLNSMVTAEKRLPWLHSAYNRAGVPSEMQTRMDHDFAFIRNSLHSIEPDQLLRGGEAIESKIGPLLVEWTPGHASGHVCLYAPEHKLLFSGDHVLDNITPNISWHPDQDALADYLKSLDQVADLDVELILPSHGKPFAGHREWVRVTKDHHRERCDQIIASIEGKETTAHELVPKLWRKKLTPVHHHFAVLEVMAHLEYMHRRGRVGARELEGAIRWERTNGGLHDRS